MTAKHQCQCKSNNSSLPPYKWAAWREFGTYRLCEQQRFRRACASAQSRQNLPCSLIQAVSQEEPSDRKPDPWPLWMARHVQLKYVMTECSKTQIRLTRPKWTESNACRVNTSKCARTITGKLRENVFECSDPEMSNISVWWVVMTWKISLL